MSTEPSTETITNVKIAESLGLNAEEFEQINKILGRAPNFTELSIFSVMWSEHCSYKNSIKYLKTLPRDGERLLVEAGEENAGLIEIGGGLACAFKIESHNHPSAIEPYQGAATGVGGIHRDIFTMGARPIAALNSLRFGALDRPHTQHLVKGVVSGIGDYGNCLGVPTIGGEVYFNSCYNQNILVNAMSVGTVRAGETVSAIAEGPGNPVYIVGSSTGKDGIHGATFASADLTEDSAEDLPAVQVGDPFQEKLLLEASLEVIQTGAIVGMQDMGAAGITCSSSEMSAKSGTGMRIDLDKVPTRQKNMKPFEILLSESQERMLIVVKKGFEHRIIEVYKKWDLECEHIGEVTDTGNVQFYAGGDLVADVPAHALVLGGGAPVYDRSYSRPKYFDEIEKFDAQKVPVAEDLVSVGKQIISSPNICSRQWVFEQYDSMVRTNTLTTNEPSDAAIIRLKETEQALAVTTDCNSAYVYADPYIGGMIAVAEAARNIVCSGGQPVAITNCLNFGNPYNEEVYYQFVHALKGMGDACRKFDTPVTGGNVSFYNQSEIDGVTVPVYPTPTIGMLGILENYDEQIPLSFKDEGDLIYMLGASSNDLGSSEYLRLIHNIEHSTVPEFDLDSEFQLHEGIRQLNARKILSSCHDVSDGGLFTTLIESGFKLNKGFDISSTEGIRKDAFLFGESQSRAVVTFKRTDQIILESILRQANVPFEILGTVTENTITIDGDDFGSIATYRDLHAATLGEKLN